MNKRIETTTSRTAEMTCVSRAASYYEKTEFFRSNDYIATKFVPLLIKSLLRLRIVRKWFRKRFAPKGIYEYVISRTKYIDEIFIKSLEENFEQILIFGAGFDSRGIRFLTSKSKTIVYELDAPKTQEAKLKQLNKRSVEIPNNVVFISIDFNKESVRDKLEQAGFKKGKKCLFILEGLIMYLDESAVNDTFKLIKDYAGKGSLIVFDTIYASVLREEHLYYGEEDIFNMVKNANEKWTFGIEKNKIQTFLEKRGFFLIEQNNSESLEQKYFTDNKGNLLTRINGTHCLVLAKIN
ncbi:MAG: SAM-dependent methyltransferase [Asgard group archaeon]|nr:SAM-dependent methyltransferase [Asgard group archaeon]